MFLLYAGIWLIVAVIIIAFFRSAMKGDDPDPPYLTKLP